MTSLAARKKLLLLESDLNRALLVAEMAGARREMHQLVHKVCSMGLLAAGVTQAGAAAKGIFNLFFHRGEDAGRPGSSWWSTLTSGARVGGLVWSLLRSQKR